MDIKEVNYRSDDVQTRHPWELARLEIVYELLEGIAFDKNADVPVVLDLGCGDIFVAENLSSHFPSAEFLCVDPAFTPEYIDGLSSRIKNKNIHIFEQLDQALKKSKRKISVVLLLDVIEHIKNDVLFLQELMEKPGINEDTYFLITVPAYQSLFSSHDVFLDHYRRYNNKQLAENLKRSGMEICKIGYFFSSLLPVRAFQVFKERMNKESIVKPTTGLVEWKGSSVSSKVLKNVLVSDFRIAQVFEKLKIKMPGLSNYAICKKSAS